MTLKEIILVAIIHIHEDTQYSNIRTVLNYNNGTCLRLYIAGM